MAIKKRLLVCDCDEQFEENADQSVSGNVAYGPWRYQQHVIRQSTQNGHDVVTVQFSRTVECGRCHNELFKEKRNYDVRPGGSKNSKADEPLSSDGTPAEPLKLVA